MNSKATVNPPKSDDKMIKVGRVAFIKKYLLSKSTL